MRWRGITRHFLCRSLTSNSREWSFGNIRKDLMSFIKLIHPDRYVSSSPQVKQTNLIFLQSLNELTDSLQQLHQKYENKDYVEVNQPLLAKYIFSFYVKIQPEGTTDETSQVVEEVREIKLLITPPPSLSTRTRLSKSGYNLAMSRFVTQLGRLFDAVHLPNPWSKEDDDENENENEDYEKLEIKGSSSNEDQRWERKGNFVRRQKEMFSETEVKDLIDEHYGNRKVERAAVWMWNTSPEELKKVIYSFHYILPDNSRSSSSVHVRKPGRRYRDNVSSSYISSLHQIANHIYPSKLSSHHYIPHSSSIYRSEPKYTEQEIQRMIEINRFILNGHIFTQSLSSKEDEIHVLNDLRVFFFEFGSILNFNYRQWSDVILMVTGNPKANQPQEGMKKKLSKYEKEIQYYHLERVENNPSTVMTTTTTTSDQPSAGTGRANTILITIPVTFKPKVLCSYLTKNVPHSNFFMNTSHVSFLEHEELMK